MVGQLRIHMKGRRGGIVYNLCRQNKGRVEEQEQLGRFEPMTYSIAWASNSGEEKDSLDHSAIGHYILSKDQQRIVQENISESHDKFYIDLRN